MSDCCSTGSPCVNRYICMIQGNTLSFGVEFKGLDQDLTTATFTVKSSYGGDLIFQKSLGNGITKVETNKYRVRVAPEDTEDVAAGNYFYNFEIGVNSDKFTIIKGILEIQENISL